MFPNPRLFAGSLIALVRLRPAETLRLGLSLRKARG
jgi:hypothetical protein